MTYPPWAYFSHALNTGEWWAWCTLFFVLVGTTIQIICIIIDKDPAEVPRDVKTWLSARFWKGGRP